MKKTLKNSKMNEMLYQLKPLLDRRDLIGYIAARNYRALTNCLTEFTTFRDDLIRKYGTPDKDENGNELSTISLKVNSPNFKKFCEEIEPFNNMEHEVELMTAKYESVVGNLSGDEILAIDWMLED